MLSYPDSLLPLVHWCCAEANCTLSSANCLKIASLHVICRIETCIYEDKKMLPCVAQILGFNELPAFMSVGFFKRNELCCVCGTPKLTEL